MSNYLVCKLRTGFPAGAPSTVRSGSSRTETVSLAGSVPTSAGRSTTTGRILQGSLTRWPWGRRTLTDSRPLETRQHWPMPDNLTREQRSRTMARIRSWDTKPELVLRHALWEAGLRGYRLHRRDVPGRPDLAWLGRRVAIFVDGSFWHGHPSAYTQGKSGQYWDAKITRNIARDRSADAALGELGWTVLRFWDFEVTKEPGRCVREIAAALGPRKVSS